MRIAFLLVTFILCFLGAFATAHLIDASALESFMVGLAWVTIWVLLEESAPND